MNLGMAPVLGSEWPACTGPPTPTVRTWEPAPMPPTGAAVTRGCAVPVGPPSDGQGECEQSVRARCGLWRGGRGVVVRGIVLGGVLGAGRGVGRRGGVRSL